MNRGKAKFKINGKLLFNIAVVLISVYLIIYFFVSENGMIDLLSTPDSFNVWWVLLAGIVFISNTIIDSIVSFFMIRSKYPNFSFFDAIKVSFVGVFFSAITPSSTGGQPMQLYLMAKKNISVGFGSACMTQKFIVYQIVTTAFSVIAIITRFDFFKSAFTNFWTTAFVIFGLLTQLIITAMFLLVSFSHKATGKLISLVEKILNKLKFIKNTENKIKTLRVEVEKFHQGNKVLFTDRKMLVKIYLLVIVQVLAILSVPYFIYLSFGMPQIAGSIGATVGNPYDFICIQSFVLFTSNLIPLPGASGGAELAFTMYFGQFFILAGANKIKPAILLWRFITYYAAILTSLPFTYFTKDKNREEMLEKELNKK